MNRFASILVYIFVLALSFIFLSGCTTAPPEYKTPARNETIPATAVKMTPANDSYPPILNSDEFETPVPFTGPVNSAGAEDSPFMTYDGNTFYFFFTPDVTVPVEKQVLDNVTGIWVSKKIGGNWSEPERVVLQDEGKLALDGCEFVQNDTIWFCSAREGYTGIHWFTAEYKNDKWQDWKNADFNADYEVGEMHIRADGNELYFGSARAGGKGGMDIWVSEKTGGVWQEPVNIESVNSVDNEGWPYISQNGRELWFTRFYQGSPAIFRSEKINGTWSSPKLIVSQFAGEPTLDDAGNLYFTHHFYKNSTMIEADIYVAYKKAN